MNKLLFVYINSRSIRAYRGEKEQEKKYFQEQFHNMLLNMEDDIIQPDEDIMEEQADYFYTSYEGIILDFMQLIVSSAPYITSLLITLILHLHNYKFTIPTHYEALSQKS